MQVWLLQVFGFVRFSLLIMMHTFSCQGALALLWPLTSSLFAPWSLLARFSPWKSLRIKTNKRSKILLKMQNRKCQHAAGAIKCLQSAFYDFLPLFIRASIISVVIRTTCFPLMCLTARQKSRKTRYHHYISTDVCQRTQAFSLPRPQSPASIHSFTAAALLKGSPAAKFTMRRFLIHFPTLEIS